MRVMTIIPARCGSKGVKNKNIVRVCGRPLIAYSIDSALKLRESGLAAECIVSTDCEKIAAVAEKQGISVPFIRPEKLAADDSKSIDYCLHAIEFFENRNVFFDAVLILQPTSPIRSHEILKQAIELFAKSNNDSLISVYKEEYINDLVIYRKLSSTRLAPLNPLHNRGVRRQEHGSIYVRNGAVYLTRVAYLKKHKLIISENPLYIEMKKSDSINVDTADDFKILTGALCG